ncbi:MAG: glycine cleavage system aminomethyltransferase GcvT [Chthoniobacterales bacterium]|nr:glycine cleavage system aminomethyltransferase GcvT [Chthoniobacterales bacterium]
MSDSVSPLQSPLKNLHQSLGARFVQFAGWQLPVFFKSILSEHHAVRNNVGLFDISHMGQFFISGSLARSWLDTLLTNDIQSLPPGRALYTFLLNESGGILDDIIVYCLDAASFLLVVNASTTSSDKEWMLDRIPDSGVHFEDASNRSLALAVQGPASPSIWEKLTQSPMPPRNSVLRSKTAFGSLILATTGYTGEIGFEIFSSESTPSLAEQLFNYLLSLGAQPCGLGARDTLRLEMAFPLNGTDLSPDITPLEANLPQFVKFQKPGFIGKNSLLIQKQNGISRLLSPLLLEPNSPPPRHASKILVEQKVISGVTSGTISPSLNRGIALATLPIQYASPNTQLLVQIRDKLYSAQVVKKPFYKKIS